MDSKTKIERGVVVPLYKGIQRKITNARILTIHISGMAYEVRQVWLEGYHEWVNETEVQFLPNISELDTQDEDCNN
jgi:hypothetical protein